MLRVHALKVVGGNFLRWARLFRPLGPAWTPLFRRRAERALLPAQRIFFAEFGHAGAIGRGFTPTHVMSNENKFPLKKQKKEVYWKGGAIYSQTRAEGLF